MKAKNTIRNNKVLYVNKEKATNLSNKSSTQWLESLEKVYDEGKQKRQSYDCLFMEAPPRLELGIKVLQTSALPLGYGAIKLIENTSVLSIMWSGLRDSNSLPSPWQGDALPDELNPHIGASGRNRTIDTRIFSPLLYRLSYRSK